VVTGDIYQFITRFNWSRAQPSAYYLRSLSSLICWLAEAQRAVFADDEMIRLATLRRRFSLDLMP